MKARVLSILLSLSSFLVFLGALEGAARALHLAPVVHRIRTGIEKTAYRPSENPVLGYVFKENYRDETPDLHESFPYTNSHGQRDIERVHAPIPGKRRTLLLGDSVVAGHGLRDLRSTISARMEALSRDGSDEVLNFGVGGYCTRGEAELLREKGVLYRPDEVIVLFVVNDYFDQNTQVDHYTFKHPRMLEWLFVQSDFFRFFSLWRDLFHFREQVDPTASSARHSLAIGPDNVDAGLRLIHELSEEHAFRAVLAVWPTFSDSAVDDDTGHPRGGRAGELLVESYASKYGIPAFRLGEAFSRDYEDRWRTGGLEPRLRNPRILYTIGDGMHPSEVGSEVGARALLQLPLPR